MTNTYSLTETGTYYAIITADFTLGETGAWTGSIANAGNTIEGNYTTTTTGSDAYAMTESGSNGIVPYWETVVGADTFTNTELGNPANQTYTRTITGSGSATVTGLFAGSYTYSYATAETADARGGQTQTGTTRYGLLERFTDVSNTGSGATPGNMNFLPYGQAFVDPGFWDDVKLIAGFIVKNPREAFVAAVQGANEAVKGAADQAAEQVVKNLPDKAVAWLAGKEGGQAIELAGALARLPWGGAVRAWWDPEGFARDLDLVTGGRVGRGLILNGGVIDRVDQLFAGWAAGLEPKVLGVRIVIWGEIAGRNHQGPWFKAGEIIGEIHLLAIELLGGGKAVARGRGGRFIVGLPANPANFGGMIQNMARRRGRNPVFLKVLQDRLNWLVVQRDGLRKARNILQWMIGRNANAGQRAQRLQRFIERHLAMLQQDIKEMERAIARHLRGR